MGSLVSSKYDKRKRKAWVRGSKKRKKPPSKELERLADELYKSIRRNFTQRRVIVNGIDEIWPQIWLKCRNSVNGTEGTVTF